MGASMQPSSPVAGEANTNANPPPRRNQRNKGARHSPRSVVRSAYRRGLCLAIRCYRAHRDAQEGRPLLRMGFGTTQGQLVPTMIFSSERVSATNELENEHKTDRVFHTLSQVESLEWVAYPGGDVCTPSSVPAEGSGSEPCACDQPVRRLHRDNPRGQCLLAWRSILGSLVTGS
ncbi:hypothetical protein BDV98DRAFT_581818 [Pterulicium gracile]|uniref:Uncharacterized protein n=1 Tax=Pterulicium gracile TaxID=1884261 RepID=A0A5C3QMJ0_9AGAR|nr:hypothetical protein BDV98DRAFT_581818 [Pterula gracilis]